MIREGQLVYIPKGSPGWYLSNHARPNEFYTREALTVPVIRDVDKESRDIEWYSGPHCTNHMHKRYAILLPQLHVPLPLHTSAAPYLVSRKHPR